MSESYGQQIYGAVCQLDLRNCLGRLRSPVKDILTGQTEQYQSVDCLGVEDASEIGIMEEYRVWLDESEESPSLCFSLALAELGTDRMLTTSYSQGEDQLFEDFVESIDDSLEDYELKRCHMGSNTEAWVFKI